MKFLHILMALSGFVLLYSCGSTRQIAYFQDLSTWTDNPDITDTVKIRLMPEDKISIIVNSKAPELADLFNLRRPEGSTSNEIMGYTIDKDGNIDFPVLGTLHIAGMTRHEVASYIKNELISGNLVKDPTVTVEFMNLTVSVLGEVSSPGMYKIEKDRITLLDALSMAGDLTIYGKRENVMVLREIDGCQQTYTVDMCSAESIYSSPVYYLQQNDVVYVEPNSMRARQSTVNGNNVRSASFWMSLASLLTTITVLFIK